MTTAQRSRAADLIEAKGQAVTITRRAAGAYDPATGSSTITTSTQAGHGVVLPLSAFRKSVGNVVDGDQQLLLSGLNAAGTALTAPKVDDTVTLVDASVHAIVSIDPLGPAGTNIIYDCVIRGPAS